MFAPSQRWHVNGREHGRNCDQDEDYGHDESQKFDAVNLIRWICRIRLAYAAVIEANRSPLPLEMMAYDRRQKMYLCARLHTRLRLHFPLCWHRPLLLPLRLPLFLYLTLPQLLDLTIARLQIVA